MATIVVSGAIANKHLNGGAVWTRLNWVLGLKQLGFRVYFVEQIDRENCLDRTGSVASFEECLNLAYFKRVTAQFGFSDSAALIYHDGEQIYGLSNEELVDLAEEAELLVNITGHLTHEPMMRRLRRKAYIDLDPGFTQFWHATGGAGACLDGHDYYFTIGENIGTATCTIPTNGIRWRPTRQPIVLEQWIVSDEGDGNCFTTIGSWRGPYGPVQYGDKTFGLKVHEFRKFVELPRRAPQTFEIALDIHPADGKDLTLLQQHGWQIVDPKLVTPDPSAFRRYIQASGAEFSVAQGIYTETNSGWFSDRTVRYLASGKPVLVQDTGFSRNYPVGKGLVAFRNLDEAVAGAKKIASDYERHCRTARALAEEYFDSDKVLGRLMEEVGIG